MAVCEMWFMSSDRIAAWLGDDINKDEMSEEYMDMVGRILLDGMVSR